MHPYLNELDYDFSDRICDGIDFGLDCVVAPEHKRFPSIHNPSRVGLATGIATDPKCAPLRRLRCGAENGTLSIRKEGVPPRLLRTIHSAAMTFNVNHATNGRRRESVKTSGFPSIIRSKNRRTVVSSAPPQSWLHERQSTLGAKSSVRDSRCCTT